MLPKPLSSLCLSWLKMDGESDSKCEAVKLKMKVDVIAGQST